MLNLTTEQAADKEALKWDKADHEKLAKVFLDGIRPMRTSLSALPGPTAINRYTAKLIEAINDAIKAAVPKAKVTPRSRTGWSEECN